VRVAGPQDALALAGWDGAGGDGPVVVLRDGEPRTTGTPGHAIGTAGPGLWRRTPWAVRDELFDLAGAADPQAVLVIGSDEIAEGLRANGAAVSTAATLSPAGLREASVVVLLAGHGALPANAMCVLAARRVLVTDATEVTFGLQTGIEFLLAASPDEAVERADIARVYPDAMHTLRVMGARAARDHRASIVYPRLAADLDR
jgi:hypothetical protein